jgi:HAE1 family hydrophobic/amphiphilic exporter-1
VLTVQRNATVVPLRAIVTVLVMVIILLCGFIGCRLLPVSDLTSVDFPTIVVSANLPGASPITMASAVATVLEKEGSATAMPNNRSAGERS